MFVNISTLFILSAVNKKKESNTKMNTLLIKEIISNIARWRNLCVVVYVNLSGPSCEKYMEEIVGDMALLTNVGINIVFACKGENNKNLLQLTRQQHIDAYNVKDENDLLKKSKSVNAVKLFFLCEVDGIFHRNKLIGEMTTEEAKEMLKKEKIITGSMKKKVQTALRACTQGVKRVHFVNGKKRGAFLKEFLSGEGSGTMIYVNDPPYKTIRQAEKEDIFDIARILRDSVGYSAIIENVVQNLEYFTVFAVDNYVHAIIMVSYCDDSAEVGFLRSSEEIKSSEAIYKLLQFAITEAQKRNKKFFYVPANKAPALIGIQPWFLRLGFKSQSLKTKQSNDYTKVWVKCL